MFSEGEKQAAEKQPVFYSKCPCMAFIASLKELLSVASMGGDEFDKLSVIPNIDKVAYFLMYFFSSCSVWDIS